MSWLLAIFFQQFLIFLLVLTRIGSLLMAMPVLGSSSVPMQVRAFLAVGVSLLITPLQSHVPVEDPGNLVNLAVILAREAVLGLSLGLAIMILLSGMQLAGQVMSQMSGMSLAEVTDPTFDNSVPIFSHLLEMLATATFFAIGGHRQLISALLGSFEWMPAGSGKLPDNLVAALAEVTGRSFELGIRASAPVMVSLLLAILVVALVSRTLPQLNSMAIGMNFNAIIVLAVMAFCMGFAVWIFHDETARVMDVVGQTFLPAET